MFLGLNPQNFADIGEINRVRARGTNKHTPEKKYIFLFFFVFVSRKNVKIEKKCENVQNQSDLERSLIFIHAVECASK